MNSTSTDMMSFAYNPPNIFERILLGIIRDPLFILVFIISIAIPILLRKKILSKILENKTKSWQAAINIIYFIIAVSLLFMVLFYAYILIRMFLEFS